jgi:hypothetical protein
MNEPPGTNPNGPEEPARTRQLLLVIADIIYLVFMINITFMRPILLHHERFPSPFLPRFHLRSGPADPINHAR